MIQCNAAETWTAKITDTGWKISG